MKKILLLPHLHIHNANALSSPYTIGFPAMTAWLGGVHALQRLLNQQGYPKLRFTSVGVCCHDMQLQAYKGRGDYVYSIVGTGNPLDKSGNRPAFVEEARCHLQVSLLIECEELSLSQHDDFLELLKKIVYGQLKMAGGDIFKLHEPLLTTVDEQVIGDPDFNRLKQQLMPGFVIIERRDLVKQAMQEHQLDALDALLSYLQVEHRSEEDEDGHVIWKSQRREPGWLVPIASGFHAISPLGKAGSQRDPGTPHRFAESIVTLGEFVMPYRIENIEQLLWHYHVDLTQNLYLCQQNIYKEIDHG